MSSSGKKLLRQIRGAERVGLTRFRLDDLYHYLLDAPWSRLLGLVLALYLASNALFAAAYLATSGGIENAREGSFVDAFFFSVQTMATIGYGKMVPRGLAADALVATEALFGLLGFAFATGLIFAKFARPTARVLWSEVCVVSTRDGMRSLMLRAANERRNQIAEAQMRLSLLVSETTDEGERVRRFHDLRLVRSSNAIFALTWTVVHPIDGASPLANHTPESLRAADAQLVASLTGIDETFSQTVHARCSWDASEILWGRRFVDIIETLPDGRRRVDYARFHDTMPWP